MNHQPSQPHHGTAVGRCVAPEPRGCDLRPVRRAVELGAADAAAETCGEPWGTWRDCHQVILMELDGTC